MTAPLSRDASGWVSLHGKIMNLPCGVADTKVDSFKDYAAGHRDARHAAAELANDADAEISRLKDENEKLLAMATARMHSDTQDIAALAGEVARLRVDAERYQFIRWYQDFDQAPEYLRDILLKAHRRSRERGALRPSVEEYEAALDEAMSGLAARSQEGA